MIWYEKTQVIYELIVIQKGYGMNRLRYGMYIFTCICKDIIKLSKFM